MHVRRCFWATDCAEKAAPEAWAAGHCLLPLPLHFSSRLIKAEQSSDGKERTTEPEMKALPPPSPLKLNSKACRHRKLKARRQKMRTPGFLVEPKVELPCEGCPWEKPHFFKKIPPAFLKHLKVGESGVAIVKDHAGRSWDIKLLRSDNGMIFEKGWKKFVEENDLEECYFLVFRYDGELQFTVIILDKSSCEKVQCVEKPPATPTADLIAGEGHCRSVDVNVERKCPSMKPWDAASSLNPNPTFRKVVTKTERHRMRILDDVPDATLPKNSCQVKLEGPDGRQWPVRYMKDSISNGHRSLPRMRRSLGSGWHDFYEGNCLKEGVACVFEFIAGKNLLKVHIHRDGTE